MYIYGSIGFIIWNGIILFSGLKSDTTPRLSSGAQKRNGGDVGILNPGRLTKEQVNLPETSTQQRGVEEATVDFESHSFQYECNEIQNLTLNFDGKNEYFWLRNFLGNCDRWSTKHVTLTGVILFSALNEILSSSIRHSVEVLTFKSITCDSFDFMPGEDSLNYVTLSESFQGLNFIETYGSCRLLYIYLKSYVTFPSPFQISYYRSCIPDSMSRVALDTLVIESGNVIITENMTGILLEQF